MNAIVAAQGAADIARAAALARLREIAERKLRYDTDLEAYAGDCLYIRPEAGGEILLRYNSDQRYINEQCDDQKRRTGKVRKVVVKARKVGTSTQVASRFYHGTSRKRGRKAFVLTQSDDATDTIFGIYERYHRRNPHAPQTGKSNAKELYFNVLDSGISVGTAGSKAVARGDTIQYFHGSEVAFWPNADVHATGALEAVPNVDGTEIILESTANGASGLFYNMVQSALRKQGDFEIIFLPWFTHASYVAEPPAGWRPPMDFIEYAVNHGLKRNQLYWAFRKNADMAAKANLPEDRICWMFRQEFPATVEEAFRASRTGRFIAADDVLRARKAKLGDQSSKAFIIGCDFACGGQGEGGDANCFIDRRGRVAGSIVYERFRERNHIEVANKLGAIIERLKPDMCFLDVGGGGSAVYDILVDRNFGEVLTLVNFGGSPRDEVKYLNKRAEMWGEMRDWLEDTGGAQIPDDDVLDGELTAPKGGENMNQQIKLEPKKDIRKEFGASPDGADALALTFAEPVRKNADKQSKTAAAASTFRPMDNTAGY